MKKYVSLLLVVCLLLTMAACGNSESTQDTSASTEAPATSQSAAAENAESNERPYEGETLTLLFMSGTYADMAREIEASFEERTGADLEIVDFPYAQLHEKMLLDFTSGSAAYDVVSVACQWDGEMAPFLEPLDDMIASDGFDIDAFNQNILDNCGRWNGVIYGIPHANTPYCIAYRTDIVPEDEIPTTWEEYIEVARKYMNPEEGLYGIAPTCAKSQYGAGFYTRIWGKGADWADEDWNVTMNTDIVRWTLESIADEISVADPACLNWSTAEATAAFQNGNAVFLEAWPTLGICLTGDSADSAVAGKWALMPMPTDGTGINLLSGWDIGINAASEKKELAWEFIKEYTSAENQLIAFNKYSILPTRMSVWEEPDVKNSNMYQTKEYLDSSVIWWRIAASEEARAEINNALHPFMCGDISVDEALEQMQTGVENALANNPPEEGMKNTTITTVKALLNQ